MIAPAGVSATSLYDAFKRTKYAPADSLSEMPPSEAIGSSLKQALNEAMAHNWGAAVVHANAAGYELVETRVSGRAYAVFRALGHIHATVVLNRAPERDLVLSAPHPSFDRGTDLQAVVFLEALGARALIMAGAHRCAAQALTVCSGSTRVCGAHAAYRTSDVAHAVDTVFQIAHGWAAMRWPRAVTLQLHGFKNRGSPVWFLFSSGGRSLEGKQAFHHRVRDRVRSALGSPDVAASCQDAADRLLRTRWACGRWNVQGRMLNGSSAPCVEGVERASGRFLHLEQVYTPIREAFHQGRRESALRQPAVRALLDALKAELPQISPD